MKIYHIALGIIIFSAVAQITTDMGIFAIPTPYQTYDSAQPKVTAMTDSVTLTDPIADYFGSGMIKAIGYAVSALSAAIIVVPLMSSYGVPLAISLPLQGLIYFVYGIGIFQIITGKGLKLYE